MGLDGERPRVLRTDLSGEWVNTSSLLSSSFSLLLSLRVSTLKVLSMMVVAAAAAAALVVLLLEWYGLQIAASGNVSLRA